MTPGDELPRGDLVVAAAAAGSAVALTLALNAVAAGASPLVRGVPLLAYLFHLVASKHASGALARPRTWAGVAAALAVGTFLAVVL